MRIPYEKEMSNAYFLKVLENNSILVTKCNEFTYKGEYKRVTPISFEIHPSVEIKEEWYK